MVRLVDECEKTVGSDLAQLPLFKTVLRETLSYFAGVVEREEKKSRKTFAHSLELARAHRSMADLARKFGDGQREVIDGHYERTIKILAALDERNAEAFEARSELGDCHHEYGIFLFERAEMAKALAHYEAGREVRESLCEPCAADGGGRACGCAGNEDVRNGLGRSYGYIGDYYLSLGDLDKAGAAYFASHRIREKLHKDHPEVPNLTIQLGRSHGNLASLWRHRGDLAKAVIEQTTGLALLPPC